jgi:hypothetical protein
LRLAAGEPSAPALVERLDLRALEAGHVRFHLAADLRLQIGEVPITFRKAREQITVEAELCRGIDRVEPILFVDR